ncbi:MAG: hypothetical protein M1482_08135, partial [Chloroflexi bacterium]|nr:hypothetical protein [Chloroflexota bacterium]
MNDRLHRFGQRVAKYTIRFQLFWLLVTLVVGLTGGVVLDRAIMGRMAQENASRTASLDVPLITQAWNIIEQDYVDRAAVQPRTLTYGAIGGMTDALGDTGHSRFLTPDMVKQESNFDQGQFEGIGAEIGTQDSHIVIVST